jgi:3-deoxy-D-arabino-heptulosonate 7-phosphate (DAHP) synthase
MKKTTVPNNKLTIVAGPCSVDQNNLKEVYQIAEMKVNNKRAIAGTRVVGLKSRTSLSPDGKNMGIDFMAFMKNLDMMIEGKNSSLFIEPPSVTIAKQICKDTGLTIATEIMSPLVQLPSFEDDVFKGKLLAWSPAVSQLGWPAMKMALFAKRNGWSVGIKNGKWKGMEKTWEGIASYVQAHIEPHKAIMIQRGIEVPEKGKFRSLPVHESAKSMKEKGFQVYFDPSHSFGPQLKNEIVNGTIEAMKLKTVDGKHVYDGVLIEVGTSVTDTEQHISLSELHELVHRLSEFRDLVSPII